MVCASGLQEHSGLRLPATAEWLKVVRTVVNRIDCRAGCLKLLTHPYVHGLQFGSRDEPLGDATLVAHYDYEVTSLVERADGLTCPRKKHHLLPPRDILALRSFAVDHSVAIEKGSLLHEI